jgi:restriction endonuclease Mrr
LGRLKGLIKDIAKILVEDESAPNRKNSTASIRNTQKLSKNVSPKYTYGTCNATVPTLSSKQLGEIEIKKQLQRDEAVNAKRDIRLKRSQLADVEIIKKYMDCYNVAKEYIDAFIDKYYIDNFDDCKDNIMLLEKLIKKKYNKGFNDVHSFIKFMIFYKKFQTRKNVIGSSDLEYLNKTFIHQFIKNIDDEDFIIIYHGFIMLKKKMQGISLDSLKGMIMKKVPDIMLERQQQKVIIDEAELSAFEENLLDITSKKSSIYDIDKMSGRAFEKLLSNLFTRLSYSVELTKASGDQGADLIIKKGAKKIAVQAKRYSSNVGNSAIQEVVASKMYYKCNAAMVISNSFFTPSAVELAHSNNVELIDRDKLVEYIDKFL